MVDGIGRMGGIVYYGIRVDNTLWYLVVERGVHEAHHSHSIRSHDCTNRRRHRSFRRQSGNSQKI